MSAKSRLLRLAGHMDQLAFVRPVTYSDGRAEDLRMIQLTSGTLEAAFMSSKCLDPAWIRWRGVNLSFLSKSGLIGRDPCDVDGDKAIRTIMIGAMMTCGLDNIHGSQVIDGKEYPTHGSIRTTPAEKLSADAYFDGDDYKLSIAGEMHQGALFGEHLVLRRKITNTYGEAGFTIRDTVENQAFAPAPVSVLYHCNFGYPLLDEGSRLILPAVETTPRDAIAENGLAHHRSMGAPVDNAPEEVFLHRMATDERGNTFAALVNDKLGLGLCIRWNANELPLLTQWKSSASGDYAMAVEPTNSGFGGRREAGDLLEPLATKDVTLQFCILDGGDAIAALEKECATLLNQ